MIKLNLKLSIFSLLFLFTVSLFIGCSSSDDSDTESNNTVPILFESATLPGTYTISFENEIHTYTFDANGTVLINYADGTNDTENWSVNNDGALLITGSVNDTFILTSGNQSSGNLKITLKDEDGTTNTTGTIKLVEIFKFNSTTLPGTYYISFLNETHTYTFNANGTVLINYGDGTNDTENWSINNDGTLLITGSVNDTFTLTSGNQSSGNLKITLKDEDGTTDITGTITIAKT